MLDLFTVFSKGGVVLYSKSVVSIRSSVVDSLVANYFVEARLGETSALIGSQKFHWTFSNELDLVFVVVYQKILQLSYVEELLSRLRDLFCSLYRDQILEYFSSENVLDQSLCDVFDFDAKYEVVLKGIEAKYAAQSKAKAPRRFEETKKYQNSLEAAKKTLEAPGSTDDQDNTEIETPKNSRGKGKGKGKNKSLKDEKPPSSDEKKKDRVWAGQVSSSKMKALDYSDIKEEDDSALLETLVNEDEKGVFNADGSYEVKDIEEASEKAKPSRFMGLLNSLTGQHVITADELDPVLASMKEHLVNKNVANEISSHLCDSVKTNIVGKKLGLASAVSDSLRESITRILTPGASVDILKEIHAANTMKRPYVMAFIGVNGVGKSTNLSKTCFWLLQNKKRVLIAACDTFRSGAVEQLGVHAKNLIKLQAGEVQLFQRGYGKDSAAIAKEATVFAQKNGFDVVLIDTAGRMQNNVSLMKALAKLVADNQPDKVIFVGEALVGNEAVDQLSKFNQALADFSGAAVPRRIDGIILTKFDTIDDKVGAALSMSYTSRAPILFVGTGQTYTDLKKMNVSHVVGALLKA